MRFLGIAVLAGSALAAGSGIVELERFGSLDLDTSARTARLSGGVRASFGEGWVEAREMVVRLLQGEGAGELLVEAEGEIRALLPVASQARGGGPGAEGAQQQTRFVSVERADRLVLRRDARRLVLSGGVVLREGDAVIVGESVEVTWTPEGDYRIVVEGGPGARARLRASDLAGLMEAD